MSDWHDALRASTAALGDLADDLRGLGALGDGWCETPAQAGERVAQHFGLARCEMRFDQFGASNPSVLTGAAEMLIDLLADAIRPLCIAPEQFGGLDPARGVHLIVDHEQFEVRAPWAHHAPVAGYYQRQRDRHVIMSCGWGGALVHEVAHYVDAIAGTGARPWSHGPEWRAALEAAPRVVDLWHDVNGGRDVSRRRRGDVRAEIFCDAWESIVALVCDFEREGQPASYDDFMPAARRPDFQPIERALLKMAASAPVRAQADA